MMIFGRKYAFILLFLIIITMHESGNVTLRKECPTDEVHKSCSFHEEYTCWAQPDRMERVKSPARRLPHCRTGCYCKKGLVREYPGGPCIVTAGCRNRKLQSVLKHLPTGYPYSPRGGIYF